MSIKTPPLILASQSPRRKELLEQIGLRFRVHASSVGEDIRVHESPRENVKRIALEKAVEVSSRFRKGIVIGADTVVVLRGRILGKPTSAKEAKRMLRFLSGREHCVYTGFALVDCASKMRTVEAEETRVRFRSLGEDEIDSYVRSGSPMDKAGAYGIQDDFGAVFVEKVNGCFYNVVGFPLAKFYTTYRKLLRQLNRHSTRR